MKFCFLMISFMLYKIHTVLSEDGLLHSRGNNQTGFKPHQRLIESCTLRLKNDSLRKVIADLAAKPETKIIEYNLVVLNQTNEALDGIVDAGRDGPNAMWAYGASRWSRVTRGYGQAMMCLQFNFEVLSLMTLSYGVEHLNIELQEQPSGCLNNLTKAERKLAALDITLRDFNSEGNITVNEDSASVCQTVMEEVNGSALFVEYCCFLESQTDELRCQAIHPNKYIHFLDVLLFILTIVVYLFGAQFIPKWMYSTSSKSSDFFLPLSQPLSRMVVVYEDKMPKNVKADKIIDLRNCTEFSECRKCVADLPTGQVIPIVVSKVNIDQTNGQFLSEGYLSVSIVGCFIQALFLCKVKELKAFKDCCDANVSRFFQHLPWISCCKLMSRILIVVLIPFPFYIRLLLYYAFEKEEMDERHAVSSEMEMSVNYNHRLIQSLTPTHPIYVVAYFFYLCFCITFLIVRRFQRVDRLQNALEAAFTDLKQSCSLHAVRLLVRNILYPFQRFGLCGFVLAPILWIILLPISVTVCLLYCTPITFLSFSIIYNLFFPSKHSQANVKQSFEYFEAESLLRCLTRNEKPRSENSSVPPLKLSRLCFKEKIKTIVNLIATIVLLMTLYSVMLICSEVAAYVGEAASYTLMGSIVNTHKVMEYGCLILLVVVYCIDACISINKIYRILNKALFSEIASRMTDVSDTNNNFSDGNRDIPGDRSKSDTHESVEHLDDITVGKNKWKIPDIVHLIDRVDTPFIPKKVFESCLLKVSGSSGPVYRSLRDITVRFVLVLFFLSFVFTVVLSFGDLYKISSTNQMLATLAGGFVPFLLSKTLNPVTSETVISLESYNKKLTKILDAFNKASLLKDLIFDKAENNLDGNKVAKKDNGGDNEGTLQSHETVDIAILVPKKRATSWDEATAITPLTSARNGGKEDTSAV